MEVGEGGWGAGPPGACGSEGSEIQDVFGGGAARWCELLGDVSWHLAGCCWAAAGRIHHGGCGPRHGFMAPGWMPWGGGVESDGTASLRASGGVRALRVADERGQDDDAGRQERPCGWLGPAFYCVSTLEQGLGRQPAFHQLGTGQVLAICSPSQWRLVHTSYGDPVWTPAYGTAIP